MRLQSKVVCRVIDATVFDWKDVSEAHLNEGVNSPVLAQRLEDIVYRFFGLRKESFCHRIPPLAAREAGSVCPWKAIDGRCRAVSGVIMAFFCAARMVS